MKMKGFVWTNDILQNVREKPFFFLNNLQGHDQSLCVILSIDHL